MAARRRLQVEEWMADSTLNEDVDRAGASYFKAADELSLKSVSLTRRVVVIQIDRAPTEAGAHVRAAAGGRREVTEVGT